MSIVPILKRRIFTRKVIYRLFQLTVWTFQKCKNAHACALRDCLGVSRAFVSDTLPKCIDREGLERRPTGTRQPNSLNKYGKRRTCHTFTNLSLFFVALKSWPPWKWRLEIFTLLYWTNFRVAHTRLLALVSDKRSRHSGWEPSPFNREGQVSSLIPWRNLDARQTF